MTARSPAFRYIGLAVFLIGCVLLAVAIVGLVPGSQPFTASYALFTQLLVNILLLVVATFMAGIGMFVFIYSGESAAPELVEK